MYNKNMKLWALSLAIIGTLFVYTITINWRPDQPITAPITSEETPYGGKVSSPCDLTLWNHVYAGDPRKFKIPQDRLKIIKGCVSVTGIIETAKAEADGDFHIRLKLDPSYENMLNAKNISGQRGDLVLEPVCANPVTQKDTLKEGVCNGFHQNVFTKDMINKHVVVVGVYVTDEEHGWNEIHPVTSIGIIQ